MEEVGASLLFASFDLQIDLMIFLANQIDNARETCYKKQ
jgi:hypothetical protein